eukprot:601210-Amphidinium_carterae.1
MAASSTTVTCASESGSVRSERLESEYQALDKISKKFDKKRNASIRERNWARASERIGAYASQHAFLT